MQRKQDRRTSAPDKRIGASDDDIVDVFTKRLTEPNIYRNVFIPVGLYHWTRHQITYGTPLNRRFTLRSSSASALTTTGT